MESGEYGHRTSLVLALVPALILSANEILLAQSTAHSVPRPATENMEPQVVEALDAAWEGLAQLLDPSADQPAAERAAAVGETCEVFHAHGSVEPAIACYRQAIELDPESERWPYLLGYMLKNQGRSTESLASLRRSEELRSDPFTRLRIGEVLAADGRVDEAARVLEPLLELNALRATVSAELGKIALLNGDAAAAVERLEAALEEQPQALSLHYPLAQAYRSLGALDAAQRHAAMAGQRQVRVADPILQQVGERSVSSETYLSMGAQALRGGDRETAVAAYTKAVELNPENQRAWMNLGVLAKQDSRTAEAEQAFAHALELDPGYGYAHFNLAELLSETDRHEEALPHYRAAVEANPKNVDFGIALGDALMQAGELQPAADQYLRVADEAPDFARPRHLRALALAALGQLDDAAEAIAVARDLAADNEDIGRAFIRLASTAPGVSNARRKQALEVAQILFDEYRSTDEGELLAMALAANGEFERAAAVQAQIVMALRDAGVETAVIDFLETNLEAYSRSQRAERPWAETADDRRRAAGGPPPPSP